jgi:hypothetical protein
VANVSAASAFRERFAERLVKSIQRSKMEAVTMDSSTTMERQLSNHDRSWDRRDGWDGLSS